MSIRLTVHACLTGNSYRSAGNYPFSQQRARFNVKDSRAYLYRVEHRHHQFDKRLLIKSSEFEEIIFDAD